MFSSKYLSEEQLRGFERYKYSCIDNSPFSNYVMHPFWNYCVQFFPKWIAPNLLTFSGFLLTIINFLLIAYYDYDFSAATKTINPVPHWVWLLASVNIFTAYTLDGIDGKQARRTGTSGPLGELFDHGVDSYSTVLIALYMFSLFGREDLPPLQMHFLVWNICLNFYFSHFEKYNTGVMFLPWAYDYTMWGVSLLLMITAIVGPSIWLVRLPGGITQAFVFQLILYVSGVLSSHWLIIYNVYKSYKNKTGKMRPFWEMLRPMMPFTALFVITTAWVLLSHNDIVVLETRMFFVLIGTVFSNISCRLIVAQMSDTRCEAWNFFFWPILAAFLVSVFPYTFLGYASLPKTYESAILYGLTAIVTVAHIHYGVGLVLEMCQHFKIKCFKISPQQELTEHIEVPLV